MAIAIIGVNTGMELRVVEEKQYTMRKTGRPVAGENLRERILEEAFQVFTENGFAGTSTRQIQLKAKVSHPTLAHHFGNKVGLYDAVVEHALEEIIGFLQRETQVSKDLRDYFERTINAVRKIQSAMPGYVSFLVSAQIDIRRNSDLNDVRRHFDHLYQYFLSSCERFTESHKQTMELVSAIQVLVHGLTVMAPERNPESFDKVITAVLKMVKGEFMPR